LKDENIYFAQSLQLIGIVHPPRSFENQRVLF